MKNKTDDKIPENYHAPCLLTAFLHLSANHFNLKSKALFQDATAACCHCSLSLGLGVHKLWRKCAVYKLNVQVSNYVYLLFGALWVLWGRASLCSFWFTLMSAAGLNQSSKAGCQKCKILC